MTEDWSTSTVRKGLELGLFGLEREKKTEGSWETLLQPFNTYGQLTRKMVTRLLRRACCDRTRGNDFKPNEGGKAMEQVAQRGRKCFIPRNAQGQVEQKSEQPDLVEDIPVDSRWLGLDDL